MAPEFSPDRSIGDSTDSDTSINRRATVTRRAVLGGALVVGSSGATWALSQSLDQRGTPLASDARSSDVEQILVDPHGRHQAGVVEPAVRQAHISVVVADLSDLAAAPDVVLALGEQVSALCGGNDPRLAGIEPARLTVTVGLGPAVVARWLPDGPGATTLPGFASDEIADGQNGGDLLLQVCADDPTVVVLAEQTLTALVEGGGGTVRWQLSGFRGAVDGSAARNLLGFHDGVSVPTSEAELSETVWMSEPAELRHATLAVVRRMPIDVGRFAMLPVSEQNAVIGRDRGTGAPLSGGHIDDDPNLQAKSNQGVYAIPTDAHVRRAHPLPAGLPGLMLRRSYSYAESADDQGLIFISFQRDLDTFVRTQARMDESDALMEFTRTTASASFLILPGFTPDQQLGTRFFARPPA